MISITLLNLVLCVIILILGILKFSTNRAALFIGIAFGLFGVSHLLTFLGMDKSLEFFLIFIRIAAYLLVAVSLFKIY